MNKTAKMVILWVAMMVSHLGFAAGVPSLDQGVNSLAIAQKLMNGISKYQFYLTHQTPEGEHTLIWRSDLRGMVHELCINNTQVLFGEETLPGVPFPKSGVMRNVEVHVEVYDTNGNTSVGYGRFSRDLLIAGDPIEVVISRFWGYEKELDIQGGNPGDNVYVDGQSVGYWSLWRNRYVIWVDATTSLVDHDYQIYNSAGVLVSGGKLDAMFNLITPNEKFAFTSVRFEGVVYVHPDMHSAYGEYYIENVIASGDTPSTYAKVFVVDGTNGARVYLSEYFREAVVYVQRDNRLVEVGRMQPVNGEWSNLALPNEHVTIVVLGEVYDEFRFFIDFGNGKS